MKHILFVVVGVLSFLSHQREIVGQTNEAVLVYFNTPNCGSCRSMRPVLASLELEGTPIRRVEITKEPFLASRYGVRTTPTFIVLVGGKELTRLEGVTRLEQLKQALNTTHHGKLVPTRAIPDSFNSAKLQSNHPENYKQLTPQSLGGRGGVYPSSLKRKANLRDPASDDWGEVMPSRSTAEAIERARAATVRLRVHDQQGYGIGTGTIIDTRKGEALILTCGHLFRDAGTRSRVEVDIFHGGRSHTIEGRVIDYDADDRDVALVAIKTYFELQPVEIGVLLEPISVGESVFTFGCDRGRLPSRFDTRITGINKYNQHLGLSNFEIHGAPIDGRSGGGLFNQKGELVGICNAADYRDDVGIYAGVGEIHWQLGRIGMSQLVRTDKRQN